jgi:predicted nucleotidyltransferase
MMDFRDYFMAKDTVNLTDISLFESQFLFKEMAVLNPNAIAKTQNAFQFIHDNNIRGVIIGGMAVSHYTQDRKLTPDVDFLTADINAVKAALQKNQMVSRPLASTGDFGGIYVPQLDADFLDANEGSDVALNHYILKTAKTATIGGVTFPIIDPAVLMIMKFVIGRDKDQTDAFKLLPTLNKAELKTHLKALKGILPQGMAKTIWDDAQWAVKV